MIEQSPHVRRTRKIMLGVIALLAWIALLPVVTAAQAWPRCISGCTANDVEFVDITSEIIGSCTPGGVVEANLFVSLYFNRNKTYCVRFVADIYIDSELAIADLVSEPLNVFSKGSYPDIYFATVSVPCGSSLSLENVQIMWSVDKAFDSVSDCEDGSCAPYGPGSKCTGDQYGTIAVSLPLDALDDNAETDEETPVDIDVLANDLRGVEPTMIVNVEDGLHGSTNESGNGTVTYTPNPDFEGTDTFTYTVGDSEGNFDSATVTVTVYPTNDRPTAEDDHSETNENESVRIPVLANDTDPDGNLIPSSISILQGPVLGTVDVDPSTGVATYFPSNGNCGSDVFTYSVADNEGATSNEATVSVSIRCNESPIANDDAATTDENTAIEINVTSNDQDPDGSLDVSLLRITSSPSFGSVSVHPSSGLVTYMPNPLSCGNDSFGYTISDDDGKVSNEATVAVAVLCDDPPLAIDDLYNIGEGETLDENSPGILANDVDSPGSPSTVTLVSNVTHGTLSLNEDGSFVYSHDGGETTSDQFTYFASSATKDSNIATVHLIVHPVNDPPAAENDDAATSEDIPVIIDVLDNDSDPDGDLLSVDWVGQPDRGSVANNGGDVTYTPDPNFHGTDTFRYAATDGNGGQAEAAVTVVVSPVNDPPMAQDDSKSVAEDTSLTIDVLANDSDPDGDSITVQSVTQPGNGTATNAGVDVSYLPHPNFHGIDTFTYTIADGHGGTSIAQVTVAVAAVNDAPIALDDNATTHEDTTVNINVLLNDSDPDGDNLIIQSVTRAENGSVTNNGFDVIYSPAIEFNGTDSFTYTISDGNGGTSTSTVTVAVTAVNDPPVAQDDSNATDEGIPVIIDVLFNDFDADGDDLVVQSVTQPGNGSATNNGTDILYTPASEFNGIDSFTYTISDGNGETATATVTLAVAAVNDPPVAADDSGATDEGSPTVIDVLANDSDPDDDSLVIQSVTQPENGSVANNGSEVIYTPASDFNGVDSFAYTISDGTGETATATVTMTVAAVNDPPVAQDDSGSTDEGTPVTIGVLLNDSDPDGDGLVVLSTSQPADGSLIVDGFNIVYTPNAQFNGLDSFTYTISDGNGETATATVTVAVAAVNDPPIAQDDEAVTGEDVSITILVLSNDTDPDGNVLSVESVSQPLHGAVISNGTNIIYSPTPDYAGPDSFSYTVSDGNGGTSTAIVSIEVLPTNDPPVAQDDSQTTWENSPITILVLSNDFDPEGDSLRIESIEQPARGDVTNTGIELVYEPDPGYSGTDNFTYVISDDNGGTSTAHVTVLVNAVNDPPIANNDSASTEEETMVVIAILGNDLDLDGDFLLIESFTQPQNGSVLNSRTNLSYIPNAGFQGVDTFTYTVADGNGGSSQATVTISVAAVNDAPIAQDDATITDEAIPVTILSLLNDSDPDGDPLQIESTTSPSNGFAEIVGTELVYTPDPGFNGVDTFTYTVSDGRGETSEATVFVAVAPVNDAPIAQDDSVTTIEEESVFVPVLINDQDPDGDPVVISSVTQPGNGIVTIIGNELLYEPDASFSGTDSFEYTIADDSGVTSSATVTVGVDPMFAGAGGADSDASSCTGRVIISELAWAGTAADSQDEWIELRNLGTAPVDLAGWTLRWRSTHPSTHEDQIWKVIELFGILPAAGEAACDQAPRDALPEITIESLDGASWRVSGKPGVPGSGYYVLERQNNDTILDLAADLIYDTERTMALDLSDLGEIVMLVNEYGEVVDTANASNLGRNGWVAGSTATRGSMERIDPLKPDTADNWQTNFGLVIQGEDAAGHPLRATPGVVNSPDLASASSVTSILPTTVRVGEILQVDFSLSRQDRRGTGWPWISVIRPGFTGVSGAGGAVDYTSYAFSGIHQTDSLYSLEIGTNNLSMGSYNFWIIYGLGQAVYIPVIVNK